MARPKIADPTFRDRLWLRLGLDNDLWCGHFDHRLSFQQTF
jgi:hypothetical protein